MTGNYLCMIIIEPQRQIQASTSIKKTRFLLNLMFQEQIGLSHTSRHMRFFFYKLLSFLSLPECLLQKSAGAPPLSWKPSLRTQCRLCGSHGILHLHLCCTFALYCNYLCVASLPTTATVEAPEEQCPCLVLPSL